MTTKKKIYTHFINSFGWKSRRRIVVFESDDWGGVRMPNRSVFKALRNQGIAVNNCPYSMYDGFETNEDFDGLFQVLRSVKDSRGRNAVFTLNFNTANPNFRHIQETNFNEYFYERFDSTYARYGVSFRVLFNGIKEKLIFPQYHGREHLNIFMWLDLLKTNRDIRAAFDLECYALGFDNSKLITLPYLAAYAPYKKVTNDSYSEIINSGAKLFRELFGFTSSSFIAPIYTYNPMLEEKVSKSGISAIQGLPIHRNPLNNNRIYRHLRAKNEVGQIQLIRNCFFEPSIGLGINWVTECLNEIENSFFHNKPAIICSHRLNFMGSLVSSNREKNLDLLHQLLREIVGRWENVEFQTSDELATHVANTM